MVHLNDVQINRWVNLNDVFGTLSIPLINTLNSNPQQLQRRLDDHIAEMVAHEFTHVLLWAERETNPATHTQTFTQYESMMTASNTPAAQAAYQQVERVAAVIIRYLARQNRIDALAAQVIPLHSGAIMQEWFVNELLTNISTIQRFGGTPSAVNIARWYAGGRIDQMRRDLMRAAAGQQVALPPMGDVGWQTLEDQFRNAVAEFYRQILQASTTRAAPPQTPAARP